MFPLPVAYSCTEFNADTEAPTIICPTNQTLETDPDQSTTVVIWTSPVAIDNSKVILLLPVMYRIKVNLILVRLKLFVKLLIGLRIKQHAHLLLMSQVSVKK